MKRRLFQLVLAEVLLVVVVGGAAGFARADAGLKLFVANGPRRHPAARRSSFGRAIVFSAVALAFSAVLCGLGPAWQFCRTSPKGALRAAGGQAKGGSRFSFREAMVGIEVALSSVSLAAAGLLVVSFFHLIRVDKGFDLTHVIAQDVSFNSSKYASGERSAFLDDAMRRLAGLPRVETVGAISQLPLLGEEWVSTLTDAAQTTRPQEENAIANFRFVTPGYFQALGLELRRGRFLEDTDRNRPTAVVSEQAAHVLWGDANPIGNMCGARAPAESRWKWSASLVRFGAKSIARPR